VNAQAILSGGRAKSRTLKKSGRNEPTGANPDTKHVKFDLVSGCHAWEEIMDVGRYVLCVTLQAFVICGVSFQAQAGLKETIAQKFNIDPNSFILNLPPRPGCLPGSIFTDDLRVPLARTKRDDPKLEFGPIFQFSVEVGFDVGGSTATGFADWFSVAAKASSVSDAVIDFKNARTVELLARAGIEAPSLG
jgi:hypothetical protein